MKRVIFKSDLLCDESYYKFIANSLFSQPYYANCP